MLNDNKKDNKDYTLLDGLYVPGSIHTFRTMVTLSARVWSGGCHPPFKDTVAEAKA